SAAGTLESYSISGDGSIIGTFSNGNTQVLGQIATATFANPQGLEKLGGNLYAAAPTSGDPQIGAAGQNGRGAIISGALEGSNVDRSQELTSLIGAQRGFQASSRVVTSSDGGLGGLMRLKRCPAATRVPGRAPGWHRPGRGPARGPRRMARPP